MKVPQKIFIQFRMDEDSLRVSIDTYKLQLAQVDTAIAAAGPSQNPLADLLKLKADLTELLQLTESSLLSFKKSQLLGFVEEQASNSEVSTPGRSTPGAAPTTDDLDSEFLAFQAALAEDNTTQSSVSQNSEVISQRAYNDSSDGETGIILDIANDDSSHSNTDLDQIAGTKCQAPFAHDWGPTHYHNAMILGVESLNGEDEPKVQILFCNPTHISMVPCQYFLEGKCRFSQDECRYSHGYVVNVEDLREYKEPDYSKLQIDSPCLARYKDGVWYDAVIKSVEENHQCKVKYKSYDETSTLDIEDILPVDHHLHNHGSDSDFSDVEDVPVKALNDEESDEEEAVPVYLWRPPQTTQAMGEWEVHTRGIASKLMAKMGYIVGQGLGRNSDGRAEPVPIKLLPPGKSLDKIMELQEKSGNQDLFDAMKKDKRKQNKEDAKVKAGYKVQEKTNVFDFINKKLGGKKGDLHSLAKHHKHHDHRPDKRHTHISEKDLQKKSSHGLNVQLVRTEEEVRNVERELQRLRQALARNEGRDKKAADTFKQKISKMEQYMDQLKNSSKSLQSHQKKRTDHKKLTIF